MNIIHTSKRKAYNSDSVLSSLQCLLGSGLSLVDGLHNALVGPCRSHGVLGQVAHLLKQPATTSTFQVSALKHNHINVSGHCSQTQPHQRFRSLLSNSLQPHQCFKSLLSNTNTSTFWVTVLKHNHINVSGHCSQTQPHQYFRSLLSNTTTSTFQVTALKHNHINVSGHCSQTGCNHINVSSHCSQTQTHQRFRSLLQPQPHQRFRSLLSNTTTSTFQVTALKHNHINVSGHCSQTACNHINVSSHCSQTQTHQRFRSVLSNSLQPHQCFKSLLSNTTTSTFQVTACSQTACNHINVSSHCSQTQTHQHFGSLFSNTTTSTFQVTAFKHNHINISGHCSQTQPHQRFRSLLSDNLKGTRSKDTSWPENVDINVQRFPSAHFLHPFCRYVYNRSTIFASNLTISECSHACSFLTNKVQRVVFDVIVITDCDRLTPQAVQPFSGVLAHVSRNPDRAAPVSAWLLARR